jgi:hypothetical protein
MRHELVLRDLDPAPPSYPDCACEYDDFLARVEELEWVGIEVPFIPHGGEVTPEAGPALAAL